jgi:hypothetical protein
MTPGDFYVRSRQFFGFLLPGALWLAAATLVFSEASVQTLAANLQQLSAVATALTLALAFAVGLVTQRTFDLTYKVSRLIVMRVPALARQDLSDATSDRGFFIAREMVRTLGAAPADGAGRPLTSIVDAEVAAGLWGERRALFLACKGVLIERESALLPRLLAAEDEIALVGMLPAPFAAFMVALWLRAAELPSLALRGSPLAWRLLLPMLLVVGELLLFRLFRHLRREETREGFRSFVVQQTVLAETRAPERETQSLPRDPSAAPQQLKSSSPSELQTR